MTNAELLFETGCADIAHMGAMIEKARHTHGTAYTQRLLQELLIKTSLSFDWNTTAQREAIVQHVLESGNVPLTHADGTMPDSIFHVLVFGTPAMRRCALKCGADMNARSENRGDTPLSFAIKTPYCNPILLDLVELGASLKKGIAFAWPSDYRAREKIRSNGYFDEAYLPELRELLSAQHLNEYPHAWHTLVDALPEYWATMQSRSPYRIYKNQVVDPVASLRDAATPGEHISMIEFIQAQGTRKLY